VARRRKGRPIDGWLIIDKPSGMTSTDVVARVKRLLQADKVGHAGTLDPLATGILPIALGQATKTVPYAMDGAKRYRFTLRFGQDTDTDDAEGRPIAESPHRPSNAEIEAALPAFTGLIEQVPPQYSAIKVAGERAYDLAREGQAVDLPARRVRIDRLALIARPDPDTAEFEVDCGKGAYMRALARDIAHALGTAGHVVALRRLAVGPFGLDRAISLDLLAELSDKGAALQPLLPVETALDDIPALALTLQEAARLRQGQAISLIELLGRVPQAADPDGGLVRVVAEGRAIAIGRLSEGLLQPQRLLERPREE